MWMGKTYNTHTSYMGGRACPKGPNVYYHLPCLSPLKIFDKRLKVINLGFYAIKL